MGSRDWTLKSDARLIVRLPDRLKLALEVMAHQDQQKLSYIVIQILASDPRVVETLAAIDSLVPVEDSTGEVISP
jgi:hypothetical protein